MQSFGDKKRKPHNDSEEIEFGPPKKRRKKAK